MNYCFTKNTISDSIKDFMKCDGLYLVPYTFSSPFFNSD